MLKVIVLMGLPGSGKTTWAKKEMEKNPGRYCRVNKDDLREMMHLGKWSKTNEKLILSVRDSIMIKALRAGQHVIVDDTNLNPSHLSRIQEVAAAQSQLDNAKYVVRVKAFETSLEDCIKNNQTRVKPVPEKVIRDMWKKYIYQPSPPVEQDVTNDSAIIVDLDGTLALIGDRDPYNPPAEAIAYDKLNMPVYDTLRHFQDAGRKIIILSGRSGKYLEETKEWLQKMHVTPDLFCMRKVGDGRPDTEIKREMFDQHVLPKYYVDFVIDDREKVVEMWRAMGLTCFQVAEGKF